jgi:adenine-specific DNA-methyltransferase
MLVVMNVQAYKSAFPAVRAVEGGTPTVVFIGNCIDIIRCIPDRLIDLTITSPPYCMGKEYERSKSVEDFVAAHEIILPEIVRITRDGGSICWQIGYHIADQTVYPLDYAVYSIMARMNEITLRNRIVWTFGHGLHGKSRFSGRHETILWFTKGENYHFNLDAVRVVQKYPGKRHYKGPRKGELSCNPKGKNPGDVWEIPNVKSNHIEKTDHPCQFPVGLAERCVRAFCPTDGIVFDPYMGSASSGVAAILNRRRFLGAESNEKYEKLASDRLLRAYQGTVPYRPVERPIYVPSSREAVARRPEQFGNVFQ